MIVLVDNFDSFVHNLARYFQLLGENTRVFRNDQIDADRVRALDPLALVLSPGPCTPQQAGASLSLVRQLAGEMPLLGICLGHQAIAAAWGADIVRGPSPVHGQASPIAHDGLREFLEVPNPLLGGRYHSLIVDEPSLSTEFEISARDERGTIMAIRHRQQLVCGWQFHPESILTESGSHLLSNFLTLCRDTRPAPAGIVPTSRQAQLEKPIL